MTPEEAPCMTRTYQLDGKDAVEARVWPPRRASDDIETWVCEHQIIGVGSGKKRHSFGGDAIQALHLALIYVSTTLYTSEEYKAGRLQWPGGMTEFDLALPVAETIRDMLNEEGKAIHRAPPLI